MRSLASEWSGSMHDRRVGEVEASQQKSRERERERERGSERVREGGRGRGAPA